MPEVEFTGPRGRSARGSGRNGNEAVAGAASEAFTRWLHRLTAVGGEAYRFAARYLLCTEYQTIKHHSRSR